MGKRVGSKPEVAAAAIPPPEGALDLHGGGEPAKTVDDLKKETREWALKGLLAEPFPWSAVKWRPTKFGEIERAVAFVHVYHYAERLDKVFGAEGWSVNYEVGQLTVTCRLSVWDNGAKVYRDGLGTMHAASGPDPIAMARDDSFREACHSFGLGRYLSRLPAVKFERDGDGVVIFFKPPAFAIPKVEDKDSPHYFRTFDPGDLMSVTIEEPPVKPTTKAEPQKVAAAAAPPNGKKEEPKPEPKKEEVKTDPKAEIERMKKKWEEIIRDCPTPPELTAKFKENWSRVPQYARDACWSHIMQTIPQHWDYDKETREFFAVESESTDAIPF